MSSITRRPVLLVLVVAAVLSIQLVPQSAFYGDDYLQISVLEGTTEGIEGGPLDHMIFSPHPHGYRIQAILWYLLIVALYAAWLRRVRPAELGGRLLPAVLLALVIFAVSG